MTQEIITYIILVAALGYIGYHFYSSIKKKAACDKCELMKEAKKANAQK